MRLIDADALIQHLQKDPLFKLVEQYGITRVIEVQPTVDAVSVIRCKECKHFTGKWCILNSRKEFDPEDRLVNGQGFCAWAERKEE